MAQKKKSGKKAKQPAVAAARKGPSYEDLLNTRRSLEAAHSQVRQIERELQSAYTYTDSFALRDQRVAAAREKLNEAREVAAELTVRMETLKQEARRI